MINIMPIPYPDEIFYSWIARYCRTVSITSKASSIREIFGSNSVTPNIYYPINLRGFLEGLPKESDISKEYIIDKHTMLPFFYFFMKNEHKIELNKLIDGSTRKRIRNLLGIKSTKIRDYGIFKVCNDCYREDRETYGEAYLHINHQVPGISICLKHMRYLKEIIILDKTLKNLFVNINDMDIDIKSINGCTEQISEEILNLSTDIQFILNNRCSSVNHDVLMNKYDNMLKTRGYKSINNLLFKSKLAKDFNQFYSIDFLRRINNIEENPQKFNEWITKITTGKIVHPIQHLLFIRFLFGGVEELISFKDEFKPFGNGPWPCLNPVADHYKKEIITDCTIYKERHYKKINGRFKCKCGFIYVRKQSEDYERDKYKITQFVEVGPIWNNKLRELILAKAYTIRDIMKIMNCSYETVVKHAGKLGLKESLDTKSRLELRGQHKDNINLVLRHREEIEYYISNNQNVSRTRICKDRRTCYSYLMKYDKEWLQRNMPEPSTKPPVIVNRTESDFVVLKKIENAIIILLNSEKPIRITLTSIARVAGYSMIIKKEYLEKLPLSKKLINESVESLEAFRKRKIELYAKR